MKKVTKALEGLLGTAAMKGVGAIAAACPERKVTPMGKRLGRLVWKLSSRYRAVAIKNLKFVYGDRMSDEQIESLAKAVFDHFGQVMVEFFWATKLTPDRMLEIVEPSAEAEQKLDQALSEGKGAIVITAHFGNWELFARWLVAKGYPLNVVARDSDHPAQAGFVNALREKGGYRVFSTGDSTSRLLQALASNELLAILPDQNSINKPVFVPFFGKLASVAPGTAILSIRSGAPILPGFLRRTPGKWEIDCYPRIDPPAGMSLSDAILSLSAAITKDIETQVDSCPEQWLWFHDRWRKRPPGE